MIGWQTSNRVTQYLYILNGQMGFVGVEMNILLKRKFSIEDESKDISKYFLAVK